MAGVPGAQPALDALAEAVDVPGAVAATLGALAGQGLAATTAAPACTTAAAARFATALLADDRLGLHAAPDALTSAIAALTSAAGAAHDAGDAAAGDAAAACRELGAAVAAALE
jgi:hypothetical protein